MADFNVTLKKKNGAGYDVLYPVTKLENIIGASSQLVDLDLQTIYNFDNDLTDSGSAGLDAVSSVDITYGVDGPDNYCITNGTSSYITLPVMSNLVTGNEKFAVFLNFYNDGTAGNRPLIGDWQSGTGTGDSWLLAYGFANDNRLTLYFRNQADTNNFSNTISYDIPVGWNTIHFSYNNGYVVVDFNEGAFIFSRDFTNVDGMVGLNNSGYNLWVGRYSNEYGNFYYKKISIKDEDDFTADELQYLYENSNFGIQEAPADSKEYVRKNKSWVESSVSGITDAPSDGQEYVRRNGTWSQNSGIGDSPSDGTPYVRQDNGWVNVPDNGAKITEDTITVIDYPVGGFKNFGSVTGAIKVTLPMAFSSTRMMIKLKLMREDGQTLDMVVAGYSYQSTPEWRFVDAYINSRAILGYAVRFGVDGGNPCFWIGETTTSWGILRVVIESVTLCVSNQEISNWKSGWTIDIDTVFGTVHETVLDTQNRLVDSPSDGTPYVRQDGGWIAPPSELTGTTEIVVLTQSAYDALGSTPDSDGKVYIITG